MPKRKSAALNSDSDDDSKSSDSGSSDTDKDMLALSKKNINKGVAGADRKPKLEAFSSSSSSSSDSESDADSEKDKKIKRRPGKRARRSASGTTQSSMSADDRDSDDGLPASEAPSSSFVAPVSISAPAPSSIVSSTMPNMDAIKSPSDLEEGEVSDEDLSDNDSEAEEFNDGYDDNLMGDDDDQRQLSAMTEKEREQEIYKRIEQRELLRGRFEMEKKLRMKKKLEAKLAKRGLKRTENTSEEAVQDEFQMDAKVRSQERKKTVEAKTDKKSQAMDLLKASRDAKIQRQQEKEKMRAEKERRREEKHAADDDDLDLRKDDDTSSSVGDKKLKKLNTSDVYSDDSASDYENEVVTKKEKKKSISDSDSRSGSDSEDDDRSRKPQYVEKVEDLNKIRLSRFKMERWLYLPFFPRVLKGCFVRLGVQGPRGTKSTYDICEIMEMQDTSKTYELGATRTNKGIRVRHGNGFKVFRFEYVSNQDFTQEEFNKWRDGYANQQIMRPTLDEIEKKVKEIKECLEYQLKEEDIESIITEKAKFKRAPVNFAAKKTQLMKEREIAVMNGDDDRTAKLATEISHLDERAQELDKARTSSISSISYINERNRKKNVEEAEKAILEELKSNKGKKVEDPFTRRNTKPRIVSKPISGLVLGLENLPGFLTPKLENGDADNSIDSKPTIDIVDGSQSAPGTILSLDDADDKKDEQLAIGDLFSAHDFDIKLDLDAKLPPNLPIVARPSMTPIKDTAPRRSLNLEEYKRKKGLI